MAEPIYKAVLVESRCSTCGLWGWNAPDVIACPMCRATTLEPRDVYQRLQNQRDFDVTIPVPNASGPRLRGPVARGRA